MSQNEIVLLSLPVPPAAAVLKKMVPPLVPVVTVDEPWIAQRVTVLLVASWRKRIVPVSEVEAVLVFWITKASPPEFRPSIVTLSAPFNSISGAPAIEPVIVRVAPPLGRM